MPLSVQAQTGEQLARAGVTGTAMLEQVSPAVSFDSTFSAASTSFSMRGALSVANAGGIQPSVGVVIDDVPVARQFEAVLDLADIDRIEVLSGPQGTLFGKNATAGVINIVSNRPRPAITGYRRFSDRYGFDLDLTPVGGEVGKGFVPNPLNYPIEIFQEPDSHNEHYKYWSQEVRVNYSISRLDVVAGAYHQNYDEHRYLRSTRAGLWSPEP